MNDESRVRDNIVKIRESKGLKQSIVAAEIGMDASTYSKIERGKLGLTVDKLSKIASCFGMSMIDVIAYPNHFVDVENLSENERNRHKPKVLVQIELEEDRKEQALKILFGDHALSILGVNQKEV
jgi:transcriptional regulator with XRE-family HTH domain